MLHTMGEVVDRHAFLCRHGRRTPRCSTTSPRTRCARPPELHRRVDVDYNALVDVPDPPRGAREDRPAAAAVHQVGRRRVRAAGASPPGYRTVTLPGRGDLAPGVDATRTTSATGRPTSSPATGSSRRRCTARTRTAAASLPARSRPTCKHLLKLEYSAVALHLKAYEDFLAGPSAVFASLPTALADVRALQQQYADSKVVTSDVPDPEMDAVVDRGHGHAPRRQGGHRARRCCGAGRQALRPARPARVSAPQLQVPAQDAQWFVLSQLDSATVGTADGRGVTFRHRDPATASGSRKRSLELNREIRRRFPELQQQYRAAWDELTSRDGLAHDVRRRRAALSRSPPSGAGEALPASLADQAQPGAQPATSRRDQEEPGEPHQLQREQPPHAGLRHQVAAVAVGEEALGLVGGVLRRQPPAEDGLELLGALGVEVGRLQAGAERAAPTGPGGGAARSRPRAGTAGSRAPRRRPASPRGTARR